MATAIESLAARSFKLGTCKRACLPNLRQAARSCHVTAQEHVSSLTKNPRSSISLATSVIRRSSYASRRYLLSDVIALSSPFVNSICLPARTYSVLPQRAIYNHPMLQNDHEEERKCWNCGRTTDPSEELFFCKCGVVQTPADGMTYFTLFGIDQNFEIDIKKLSEEYKNLQKRLHPDMFSNKSKEEQELAEQQSAFLNKAYFSLLKPLPRAQYLLSLYGFDIEEGSTEMNPDFLMEVLDLNERIGESTTGEMENIENEIVSKIQEYTKQLSDAFSSGDIIKARDITSRLKYYDNVEAKIKAFYRDRM
ncbi:iron-sulfur cluster co-chaperone protein HscB, mitochondrial-like [Pomacea canaliculata]|nr:iron-sulfur cluster co-chaperone protein HscB, mitochondrial-like [Pomacea canaliculata]